jgi:hypothetical protein
MINNKSMNIENISLTMENNAVKPVVTNQSLTPWQQKMKKLLLPKVILHKS